MSTPHSPNQPRVPADPGEGDSLDLREYLRPIWQRKWLIVLIVVLAAGGTYAVESLKHRAKPVPVYMSSTQVYITNADPGDSVGAAASSTTLPDGQQMSDLAHLFTDQANLEAVYDQLGLPVGSAGSLTVSPLNSSAFTGTSILVVTATSGSPTLAAKLANTAVSVFLSGQDRQYTSAALQQAKTLETEIAGLGTTGGGTRQSLVVQLAALRADARNPNPGASQLSKAPVPLAPEPTAAPRSKVVDAAIGAVIGLLVAIGIAIALNLLDRRLTRVAAIEQRYGRSILAVLPHVSDAAPLRDGVPLIPQQLIEALRALRINLRLAHGATAPRTLLVTSAVPGEGKSTLARNLALVHADGGDRVLLIDADLRRPSVPGLFRISPETGLTHVLRGQAWAVDSVVPVLGGGERDSGEPRSNGVWQGGQTPFDPQGSPGSLDILTHGDLIDNPVTLLASDAMRSLIDAARNQYDVVIIDSAPILAVTDTVPLLGLVDAIVLVARVGVTTRDAADRLSEMMGRVPEANVVGVVANDVRDTFLETSYSGMYSSRSGGYGYRGRVRESKMTANAG